MTAPAAPVGALTGTHAGHAGGAERSRVVRKGGSATAEAMLQRFGGSAETWLALAVVVIVALLIVPLPPVMLDVLLATSLAISILVLLVTLSVSDPLEFSIFPSLLLLVTLLRLGLNVNSTRLILSQGHAGAVIAAFGNAVIGGNFVVGLVIFLILIVINFMVITKGAGRIAEVAARFTLDAMPGRQMAIDADLGAGLIDEAEARRRRQEIQRYADFFGSMDGAAKFVRGDAIAGLLITGINLIGGFIIGVTQQGMSASEALGTFTSLTVGDGLVTQIPALIVSTAAGIIVTYGANSPAMGPTIALQLTRHQNALWMASAIIGLLGLLPGFPLLPFLVLSAALAGIAWVVRGKQERERVPTAEVQTKSMAKPESTPIKDLMQVEPLELEVGYALVPLVDESQKGDLLQRIGLMRKQLALEMGIIVPPARIRDNIQLPATEYAIKLRGVRVASGEILPRYLMALDTTGVAAPIDGIRTTDPSFGLPALWITPDRRTEAEAHGYSVVEPQTVLSTHLMETIKRHSAELLSRQNVRELLDALKETHPALVDDTVPGKLSLGTVHRVLQRLLREGIPVRDLALVLETLADAAEVTKDPEALAEQVRRSLSSVLVQMYDEGDGSISGITMGPRLEAALMGLFSPRPAREGARGIEPEELTGALRQLNDLMTLHRRDGQYRPLITPPALRVGVRRLVEPVMPFLPVLSLGELPAQTPIQSLATWELPRAA
ncbi:MAG: flagellar biosynthesis protein FlhA [Gemmatimonadales bacterium]